MPQYNHRAALVALADHLRESEDQRKAEPIYSQSYKDTITRLIDEFAKATEASSLDEASGPLAAYSMVGMMIMGALDGTTHDDPMAEGEVCGGCLGETTMRFQAAWAMGFRLTVKHKEEPANA